MKEIVKYHIGKNGKIEICKAFIFACPYEKKGNPHFSSIKEAEDYIEALQQREKEEGEKQKKKIKEEINEEISDGLYLKNKLFNHSYKTNEDYRNFFNALTGGEEFGGEIAYSQKQTYAKWGINAYLDRNPGTFFTKMNDSHYKALSDFCDLYNNYRFQNSPRRNVNMTTIHRCQNILKAYETAREIGYSNNTIHFEAVTTDPTTSKNLFSKIREDEDGNIKNLYFIGEEGMKDIDTFEAGKVIEIDYINNTIYTEENPNGFKLRLHKINPQGKKAESRAIFAIDPAIKGKIVDDWFAIHSNEVDNESDLTNDGSLRETISRGFFGFENSNKFRTVDIDYFNNFTQEHNQEIKGKGSYRNYL